MKKFMTLALSCFMVITMMGCSKDKEEVTEDNTNQMMDEGYFDSYTGLYDRSIGTLGAYGMYTDYDTVINGYKDKEYPGNKEYLTEVKSAYTDSKEKIQTFVDGLEKDVTTEDEELKKMNEELIAEGQKYIKEIDTRIANLEKVTDDDYTKDQDTFIRYIDDTSNTGIDMNNSFRDMLNDMDLRLGIDRTTIEKNNTEDTTK